jgi:hypothetical protein
LKTKHSLGTNTAWWLAGRSVGKGEETGDPDHYLRATEKPAGSAGDLMTADYIKGAISEVKKDIDAGRN